MNHRWLRQQKGTYDFDVSKSDKLFEALLKEGRIKLQEGHAMLCPEGVKDKRFCGFHNTTSHHINDCRVFRMKIQRAIQEGHLKFSGKMKVDDTPFAQNTVTFSVNMVTIDNSKSGGKAKVLTSDRAKKTGAVDPDRQITNKEFRQHSQDSRNEKEEVPKPRVTTRILLNKWHREQERYRAEVL